MPQVIVFYPGCNLRVSFQDNIVSATGYDGHALRCHQILHVTVGDTLVVKRNFLRNDYSTMLSPSEVAAVDELAHQYLSGNNSPEILIMTQKWEDVSAIPQIQDVFSRSESPQTLFFVSKALEKISAKYSPQWGDSEFSSLAEWCLGSLKARAPFLFNLGQLGNMISNSLAVTFGTLVFQGWVCSGFCQNFYQVTNEMFPPSDILCLSYGLKIFRGVVEYAAANQEQKTAVKGKFKDDILSMLFVHALNALRQGPIVGDIDLSIALELADACLKFSEVQEVAKKDSRDSGGPSDEIIADRCQPSVSFKDKLVSPELYNLLFSIITAQDLVEGIRIKALDVVYRICCIKEAFYGTRENKMAVADCLCSGLARALEIDGLVSSESMFHKTSMILYKMRLQMSTETTQALDSYTSMLHAVNVATMVKIKDKDSFYDIHQSLVYLMRFWGNCAVKDQRGVLHDQLKPLFQEYIHTLIAMSTYDPVRFVEDILKLEEGKLCDEVTTVPILLKLDFVALSRPLLETMSGAMGEFLNGLKSPGNDEALASLDAKIAVIIELLSAALKNWVVTKTRETITDYEVEFFTTVYNYLNETVPLVPVMMERKLFNNEIAGVIFLKYVPDYVFDKKVGPDTTFYLAEAAGIPHVCAMYDWVVNRILVSLSAIHVAGPLHVRTGLSALEKSLKKCIEITRNEKSELDPMNCWRALLEMQSGDSPIPFTQDFRNFKREIVRFMSIMTEAVLHSPSLADPFVARMDAQFQKVVESRDPMALYLLFLDLTGVFSNPGKNFEMLFRWIFPHKLEPIQAVIDQAFGNEDVLNAVLKLWVLLVTPDTKSTVPTSRIQKQNHSADGIVLFKMVAFVLNKTFSFLAKLPPSTSPDDHKYKPMTYALRIYAEIMNADYVMYGAFDLYGDTVLKDLLVCFIEMMNTLDMTQIWGRVKLGRAIMEVAKSLLSRHAMTVLATSEPFFDCIIGIITEGYRRVDPKSVDAAGEAAKNLAEFLLENKSEAPIIATMNRNQNRLMDLVAASVEYLLNYAEYKYPNQVFLRYIFILNPQLVGAIYDRLVQQIPEQDRERFSEIFAEINAQLPTLAVTSDSGLFTKSLSKLRQFGSGRNLTLSSH